MFDFDNPYTLATYLCVAVAALVIILLVLTIPSGEGPDGGPQ